MRDVDMMAATMRRIQGSGGGFAHRLQTCPHAFAWLAGSAALNGQAVSDLIADGCLRHTDVDYRPATNTGGIFLCRINR